MLIAGGRLFAGTNSPRHMHQMKDLCLRFLGEQTPLVGHMPFTLENGEAQMRPFFKQIEVRRISGELRVTDPQAVVRYMMSMPEAPQRIVGATLAELETLAGDQVTSEGAYVFTTEAGMFVATS